MFLQRVSRQTLLVCVASWLVSACGCGAKLPIVEGTVTLDGNPVANARVVFESPDRPTATAKTDDSGKYDMRTASQRGIAEGAYKVAISAYQTKDGGTESPMPLLVTPKKYNAAASSGLTAEVVAGRNVLDFPLESKQPR